ncbi:MAG: PilN domain-containing protein [Sphaerochaetaceae bacterium]
MQVSFLRTLKVKSGILSGNSWWCLERSSDASRISQWVHINGRASRIGAFSGSLLQCKVYQCAHCGGEDGVLFLDDSVPPRLLAADGDSPFAGDDGGATYIPGFQTADFRTVRPEGRTFSVTLATKAAEASAAEAEQAGFRILAQCPAVIFQTEALPVHPENPAEIFLSIYADHSDCWLFSAGNLLAFHRIAACDGERLSSLVKKDFQKRHALPDSPKIQYKAYETPEPGLAKFLEASGAASFEPSGDPAAYAAEDAWMFHTDALPSVCPSPSGQALSRLREAALFRKTARLSGAVILISALALVLLSIFVISYRLYTKNDVAAIETALENQRKIDALSMQLAGERQTAEDFLRYKSDAAASMVALSRLLPPDVWLTNWELTDGKQTLNGFALSEASVSAFLSALEKSGTFTAVRLRTTEKTTWNGKPAVRFDLVTEVP